MKIPAKPKMSNLKSLAEIQKSHGYIELREDKSRFPKSKIILNWKIARSTEESTINLQLHTDHRNRDHNPAEALAGSRTIFRFEINETTKLIIHDSVKTNQGYNLEPYGFPWSISHWNILHWVNANSNKWKNHRNSFSMEMRVASRTHRSWWPFNPHNLNLQLKAQVLPFQVICSCSPYSKTMLFEWKEKNNFF